MSCQWSVLSIGTSIGTADATPRNLGQISHQIVGDLHIYCDYIQTTQSDASRHSLLLTVLDRVVNGSQQALASARWNPLRSLAKSSILTILGKITRGQLVIESQGQEYKFGDQYTLPLHIAGSADSLHARIKVLEEGFWVRLLLHADFGFADGYMLQEIEVDNLGNVFKIFVLNRKDISEMATLVSPLIRTMSYLSNLRLANWISGSQHNISSHYDLSNDVFAAFLSWDMTYSCAIFDNEAKGAIGDLLEERPIAPPRRSYKDVRTIPPDDLERGQLEKLHRVAQRARLTQGSRVLEIGCGWGSFAIMAAGTYGATVDVITISLEQMQALEVTIEAAGLSDRITAHVMDYREMPESFHHAFDAVISIGVMEHVGIEFMPGWFKQMAWAMKPENSFKVFTMSTVPDTRWPMYSAEVDFVRKYIYPGGQLSSVKTLVDAITSANLNVLSIEDIGPHYARTLREWCYRFENNFDSHIKPALEVKYPFLNSEQLEIFKRKWIYYFTYSEAGFALRSISDHIFVVTREANLHID